MFSTIIYFRFNQTRKCFMITEQELYHLMFFIRIFYNYLFNEMYSSDVIRAYKGLLKEKEVLEASLSALTSVEKKTEDAGTEDQQNSSEKETESAQSDASANGHPKNNEQVIIF